MAVCLHGEDLQCALHTFQLGFLVNVSYRSFVCLNSEVPIQFLNAAFLLSNGAVLVSSSSIIAVVMFLFGFIVIQTKLYEALEVQKLVGILLFKNGKKS